MNHKVNLVFNCGGKWILKPQVLYIKKLSHVLQAYDVDLLSYIDICSEYIKNCGFSKVEQLLVIGPSGRYFIVESDSGIRTIQSSLSNNFCVLQLFAINEGEVHVTVPSIIHYNEPYNVSVDVGTDCESSEDDEPYAYMINSSDYDTDELDLFRKERTREINDKLDKYKELEMGMSFKDLAEAKRVVGYYVVVNNKGLRIEKSDTGRVRYSCDVGCPFVCLISRDNRAQGFKIKTLKSKYNCAPAYKNRRATPQALAHYFKNKVQNNPKYKVKDMRVDLEDRFSLNISYSKMKRVKRLVLEKLEGSYIDDYNRLEAYAQELRDSNPGSDVIINISKDALAEGKRRFLKMYVYFQALKSGWKAGLRPLIGLDGTFLKGKCRGILMVVMAQDSVKYFYPLAWIVVDRETSRTWKWLMELLRSPLELGDGEGVTFMSDMQKGLLDVVSTVVPKLHHRWCVRHFEANWSKNWRGVKMKKLLWWCAWSTYEEEFKDHLKTMGDINKNAAKDLIWYPPHNWCRAYFDTTCKNYMVDNNFTELFNKWILEARQKPIIKILKDIRVKVMTMLKDREEECRTWRGEFSPYVMELLNNFTQNAQWCEVIFNGDNGYEVVEGADRHTVNLLLKKCTCRTWDLSGISCPHAIKALDNNKEDPLSEVHWWYSKKAYMLVYMHKLQSVRGDKFWKFEPTHAMDSPEVHRMVGRPKVKRKREKDEARKREGVWSASRKGACDDMWALWQ